MTADDRSTDARSPDLGRALGVMIDALVVSPWETGLEAVRDPAGAVGRVRQELRNARMIGAMVTNGGAASFESARTGRASSSRSPAAARDATATRTPPTTSPSAPTRAASDSAPDVGRADVADSELAPDPADDIPAGGDLAVPDYDQLPAIDIVDQLADLTPAERDAIERYELAHRRRRTVLGKIDQLRSA